MTKLKKPAILLLVILFLMIGSCKKSNSEPEPEPKPATFDCSPWENITGEVPLTNEVGKVAFSLYDNPFIGWQLATQDGLTDRKNLNASHICAVNEGLQKKLFVKTGSSNAFTKDGLKYEYILIDRTFTFLVRNGDKLVVMITWFNTNS